MKNDLKYIDEFYKNNLEGLQAETETDVWGKLKWTLFWWRYKRLLTAGTIIALASLAIILPYTIMNSDSAGPVVNKSITQQNIDFKQNQNSNALPVDIDNEKDVDEQTIIIVEETSMENSASQTTLVGDANTSSETYTALNAESSDLNNEAYSSEPEPVVIYNYNEGSSLQKQVFLSPLESANVDFLKFLLPDTSLMGINRRTDLRTPGIKKQWLSLNIFIGPSYSQSLLSGNDSEYLGLRNTNEANTNSFSVGSDLKVHIKNFVITTGINYAVYNQNRYYKNIYQVYSPEDSYYQYDTTWVYVYDPPDYGKPVVSSIDSAWKEVYNQVIDDYSGINRVEYFEIPLMLGYRYNRNLFTIELNAGASAGFLVYSNFKAPSLSNHDEIVRIDKMNKTMFNFIANMSVYYQINRTTSLFVSPYYKQNLNSIYKENYPINHKFKTFGLNFGVNIRF